MTSMAAEATNDAAFKGEPDEVVPPSTFEQTLDDMGLEKTRLSRASPSAVCVSEFPSPAESKTSADATTKPEGKADAHVAFGNVHVRLYVSGLSDHPCVSSGVPVGLTDDWLETEEVSLEDHEIECANSPPRPWMHVSTLSQAQRLDRCLQTGVSPEEIQRTMVEVQQVQENRLQSLPLLPGVDVGSAIEESIAEMYTAAANKAKNTLSSWASRLKAWGDEPVAYNDEPTSPERPVRPRLARSGSDLDRARAEAVAAGVDLGAAEPPPPPQRKPRRSSSFDGLVSWLQQGAEGFTAKPSGGCGYGYGSPMRPGRPQGGQWPPEDSEETLEL